MNRELAFGIADSSIKDEAFVKLYTNNEERSAIVGRFVIVSEKDDKELRGKGMIRFVPLSSWDYHESSPNKIDGTRIFDVEVLKQIRYAKVSEI